MSGRFCFDVRDLEEGERPLAWARVIGRSFTGVRVRPGGPGFLARVERKGHAGLNLGFVQSSSSEVDALGCPGRDHPDETVLLHLHVAGDVRYLQSGRAAVPRVGDMVFCSTEQPYRLLTGTFGTLVLSLPAAGLERHGIAAGQLSGLLLSGASGPSAALSRLLREVWRAAPRAGPAVSMVSQDAIFDLIRLSLEWSKAGAPDPGPDHMLADLVEDHLGDPDLGVAFLSARTRLSIRQIQRRFARQGTTASLFILNRRLDRASDLLRDRPDLTVTQIAYELGFSDLSYFVRSFRRLHGQSPTRYRRDMSSPSHEL